MKRVFIIHLRLQLSRSFGTTSMSVAWFDGIAFYSQMPVTGKVRRVITGKTFSQRKEYGYVSGRIGRCFPLFLLLRVGCQHKPEEFDMRVKKCKESRSPFAH